jgi:hypothetical protein
LIAEEKCGKIMVGCGHGLSEVEKGEEEAEGGNA